MGQSSCGARESRGQTSKRRRPQTLWPYWELKANLKNKRRNIGKQRDNPRHKEKMAKRI